MDEHLAKVWVCSQLTNIIRNLSEEQAGISLHSQWICAECGTAVVPELLRTLVFARPCGGDQFAAGTVSPSLDMSR